MKAVCSEEGDGEVSERPAGETKGVVDVDRGGGCAAAAVGVRPAHGNPDLGARVGWGWAERGRCNCYMSEPEHAQQLPSHDVPASAIAEQHLLGERQSNTHHSELAHKAQQDMGGCSTSVTYSQVSATALCT